MAAPVGKRSIALNAIERLPRTARSPAGGIAALVVLNHDWLAAVSNSRAAVGRGGRAYFHFAKALGHVQIVSAEGRCCSAHKGTVKRTSAHAARGATPTSARRGLQRLIGRWRVRQPMHRGGPGREDQRSV